MTRVPALHAPLLLLAAFAIATPVRAQDAAIRETEVVPPAAAHTAATTSRLHDAVTRFEIDRAALLRRHDAPYSSARRERLREFYAGWNQRLSGLPFESWDTESRIDYVLLRAELAYQLSLLQLEERSAAEMAPLLPFSSDVVALQESRRSLDPIDPPAVASTLATIADAVDETRRGVEAGVRSGVPVLNVFTTKEACGDAAVSIDGWRCRIANITTIPTIPLLMQAGTSLERRVAARLTRSHDSTSASRSRRKLDSDGSVSLFQAGTWSVSRT